MLHLNVPLIWDMQPRTMAESLQAFIPFSRQFHWLTALQGKTKSAAFVFGWKRNLQILCPIRGFTLNAILHAAIICPFKSKINSWLQQVILKYPYKTTTPMKMSMHSCVILTCLWIFSYLHYYKCYYYYNSMILNEVYSLVEQNLVVRFHVSCF